MSAEVKHPEKFAVFATSRDCVNTWTWFPTLTAAAKFVERILTENGGVATQATVLEVLSTARVEPVVKWTALKEGEVLQAYEAPRPNAEMCGRGGMPDHCLSCERDFACWSTGKHCVKQLLEKGDGKTP